MLQAAEDNTREQSRPVWVAPTRIALYCEAAAENALSEQPAEATSCVIVTSFPKHPNIS